MQFDYETAFWEAALPFFMGLPEEHKRLAFELGEACRGMSQEPHNLLCPYPDDESLVERVRSLCPRDASRLAWAIHATGHWNPTGLAPIPWQASSVIVRSICEKYKGRLRFGSSFRGATSGVSAELWCNDGALSVGLSHLHRFGNVFSVGWCDDKTIGAVEEIVRPHLAKLEGSITSHTRRSLDKVYDAIAADLEAFRGSNDDTPPKTDGFMVEDGVVERRREAASFPFEIAKMKLDKFAAAAVACLDACHGGHDAVYTLALKTGVFNEHRLSMWGEALRSKFPDAKVPTKVAGGDWRDLAESLRKYV